MIGTFLKSFFKLYYTSNDFLPTVIAVTCPKILESWRLLFGIWITDNDILSHCPYNEQECRVDTINELGKSHDSNDQIKRSDENVGNSGLVEKHLYVVSMFTLDPSKIVLEGGNPANNHVRDTYYSNPASILKFISLSDSGTNLRGAVLDYSPTGTIFNSEIYKSSLNLNLENTVCQVKFTLLDQNSNRITKKGEILDPLMTFVRPGVFTFNITSGTSVSDNTLDSTISSDHPTSLIGEAHHSEIDGGGWSLVKRAKHRWFASEDKLEGTSEYGEFIDDIGACSEFSRKFHDTDFNEFLIAQGDSENWMIVTKEQLIGDDGSAVYSANDTRRIRVLKMSGQDIENDVEIQTWNRKLNGLSHPRIYLPGKPNIPFYVARNLTSDTRNLDTNDGINVFIRTRLPDGRVRPPKHHRTSYDFGNFTEAHSIYSQYAYETRRFDQMNNFSRKLDEGFWCGLSNIKLEVEAKCSDGFRTSETDTETLSVPVTCDHTPEIKAFGPNVTFTFSGKICEHIPDIVSVEDFQVSQCNNGATFINLNSVAEKGMDGNVDSVVHTHGQHSSNGRSWLTYKVVLLKMQEYDKNT